MHGRPRRFRWLLAGGTVVVLVLGGGALLTRDSSQPVQRGRALDRFREQIAHAGPAATLRRRSVPAAGVYLYATRGYEQAKALGTSRHSYPPETTVTVVPTICGWRERWDALTTRFEERAYCLAPRGRRLESDTDAHAFFGTSDRRTYLCSSGSLAAPPLERRGGAFASRCAISGTQLEESGSAVGTETLLVGATRVPTVHLRSRSRTSGDTTGTGMTDRWLARPSGLLVRAVVANESATRTIVGRVPYVERFELRLRSLNPLR